MLSYTAHIGGESGGEQPLVTIPINPVHCPRLRFQLLPGEGIPLPGCSVAPDGSCSIPVLREEAVFLPGETQGAVCMDWE